MNAFLSFYRGLFRSSDAEPSDFAKTRLARVMKRLWHIADLPTLVTFLTGIMAGLLIASRDWPAVIAVILAGAVLQRVIIRIDRQGADLQTRREDSQKIL
ncbi:MAG: hypothetical protein ACREQ4_07645 [Candidatus Binataceae bacterium]